MWPETKTLLIYGAVVLIAGYLLGLLTATPAH
jgi:hypothetical protein